MNNLIQYTKQFSREKVSQSDMNKAENSGVVQKKPNGKWGIISKQKGEWWDADYETEEKANNALKAYHAGKFWQSK